MSRGSAAAESRNTATTKPTNNTAAAAWKNCSSRGTRRAFSCIHVSTDTSARYGKSAAPSVMTRAAFIGAADVHGAPMRKQDEFSSRIAAMIVFDNVAKRYPNGREALGGVSFNIQPGEFVFLTGRSGAGKSSVLKLIALLERPTRGTVTVGGQNTGKLKSSRIPAYRRSLGVVFQDHKLLVDRPIYDNVALPLVLAGTPLQVV